MTKQRFVVRQLEFLMDGITCSLRIGPVKDFRVLMSLTQIK